MNKKNILAAALMAAGVLTSGFAGANEVNPIYVGGAIGLKAGSADAGESAKAYVGYTFPETSALLGVPFKSSVELDLYQIGTGQALRSRGASVVYKADFAITNAFSVNAKAGLSHMSTRQWGQDKSSTGLTAGLGMSYALDKNWTVTADVDRVKADTAFGSGHRHVNMWSVGVRYKF